MVGEQWPVLVTRRLPDPAMERIAASCEVTLYEGEDAMPRDQLLNAANYAVGYDNIDVEACARRGVLASNTPDVLTETTADLAWALMMASARRIPEGDRFLRARTGWIWGPMMMLGQDVHHKVLGIVGFGRIGQAMARRAQGFGMKVIYHDVYRPPPEVEREFGAEYRELDD